MPVKVIVADTRLNCDHIVGQFADESMYDTLIDFDADVYGPADTAVDSDTSLNEGRVQLKFRKNFFSAAEQESAYLGLRDGATLTNNRGKAAGPRSDVEGLRLWVKEWEYEIIKYFLDPYTPIGEGHPVEDVIARRESLMGVAEPLNRVWMSSHHPTESSFSFLAWAEEQLRNYRAGEVKKCVEAANELLDQGISTTTYANNVLSGIGGMYGRTPRTPYARLTSYSEKNYDNYAKSFPFLKALDLGFQELMPVRHAAQKEFLSSMDPAFSIAGTAFTTLTINKTFRTACHLDAGDFGPGFSNLTVVSNNGNYSGGYLVLPEFRLAVNVRPGDLLLIANHTAIHGNTPIELLDDKAERVSIVAYAREDLKVCGSWEYERARFQFIEDRRLNPNHPLQRKLWNGVSPGCMESQELADFFYEKYPESADEWISKYHPNLSAASSLEDFFT